MPHTNNTAALRTWLRRCGTVERERLFGADYLAEGASYSLDSVPTALRYRENILGRRVLRETQEQNYLFASREPYGARIGQNLDNLGIMQDITAWIIDRNDAGDFPDWEGGEVVSVTPTLSPHPVAPGSAFARYQIQIRVTYRVGEMQNAERRTLNAE